MAEGTYAVLRRLGWSWPKIVRVEARTFVRDTRRGRPCVCHACGRRMAAGQFIERVRVSTLPWQRWRHQVCDAPYRRKVANV